MSNAKFDGTQAMEEPTPHGSLSMEVYKMGRRMIDETVSHLEGRILTIIDASIQDPAQRKAVKDLVKGEIHNGWDFHSMDFREIMLVISEHIGDEEFPKSFYNLSGTGRLPEELHLKYSYNRSEVNIKLQK